MNTMRPLSLFVLLALIVPISVDAYTVDTFKKKMTSSAASSISSTRALATEASFNRNRGRDIANTSDDSSSTFVPFLERFITLPAGWKGTVAKQDTSVTFKKSATDKEPASSMTIQLFPYVECDKNHIEVSQAKSWKEAGKAVEGKIDIARAYGAAGLGLTWLEPSATGTVRQFCAAPIGNILTAKVTILASDLQTSEMVERQLLAQILRTDRFGRRR